MSQPATPTSGLSFNDRLNNHASLVEERFSALLAHADAPPRLVAAMRHGALGGGKRLRPFLVIESAALFGLAPAQALDAAIALEAVHCYSLVHDDLPAMDNDDMRRGQPTVHKAYDDATAILAGDSLLTLAFEILAQPATHPDPAVRVALVAGLARASGWAGMAGGQMLDLEAESAATPLDVAAIRRLQALKTGALLVYACDAGAILGGAGAAERAALLAYGDALGRAFQLADDILDVTGDAATVGKATGKDAAAGKATIPQLLGLDMARAHLAELEAAAVAALGPFGTRGAVLAEAARFVTARKS